MKDIFSDYVEDDISNFFLKKLKYFESRPKDFYFQATTMKGDYFGTGNLLPFLDEKAFTYLKRIKDKVEEKVSSLFVYHHLHMLDYKKGGHISLHNHVHAEDYSSLLYLNDCDDGATYFISGDKKYEILPEKNKLIIYPSHIFHGGRYTTSKKVLVSGYKFKYNFLST